MKCKREASLSWERNRKNILVNFSDFLWSEPYQNGVCSVSIEEEYVRTRYGPGMEWVGIGVRIVLKGFGKGEN